MEGAPSWWMWWLFSRASSFDVAEVEWGRAGSEDTLSLLALVLGWWLEWMCMWLLWVLVPMVDEVSIAV